MTTEADLEQTLIEVWRQELVENARILELRGESYPIRTISRRKLRQVDFVYDGREIRGLEQNPETKSRRAQLARAGKKAMRSIGEGGYIAAVADGTVTIYGKHSRPKS
jgi:hypothetical protein